MLLASLLIVLSLAGCGDEDTPEAEPAATIGTAATAMEKTGTSAQEIDNYVEQVRELVHIADQLNAGYRDLVDRYNSKDATPEEVIAEAKRNENSYGDMVAQLESIEVPDGLEDAHDRIVSGFDKWRQMYALDTRGVQEQDSALLDQARVLDSEATAEVNGAIGDINRFKG